MYIGVTLTRTALDRTGCATPAQSEAVRVGATSESQSKS